MAPHGRSGCNRGPAVKPAKKRSSAKRPAAATTAASSLPDEAPPKLAAGGILAEITSGLAAGSDLQQLLARFMPPLVELAHADAGAIRVLDDAGEHMLLVASQGLPDAVRRAESTMPGSCGACGRTAQGDMPVWSDDLAECARRHDGQYFGSACRRMLTVPLTHRGRTLGVCNLFYAEGHEPPPGSLSLLVSVGALLGLALAHARLERENLRAMVLHERQAIAAEVHDSIGQSLAFVKMRLPLLHDAIQANDADEARRYFGDVRQAVSQAHASLRGILSQFRAPPDPLGFAHALEVSASMFRQASTAQLVLHDELPAGLLSPAQEHQVAQVVQEALLNAARHAQAQQAWVHLRTTPGAGIEVLVQDDGIGPTPAARDAAAPAQASGAAGSHYGLDIMRERARRLGGTLSVSARAGGGTSVRLVFAASPPAAQSQAQAPAGSGAELHR